MKILTIIMVAHDHLEQTKKALESLAKWTDPAKYKLLFCDMNSMDDTCSWVPCFCRDNGIECQYQYFDENNGRWIEAINSAYPMVNTEFSLTVHNDVVFSNQWLERMMRRFDDPQVAAVGPVITFAMGPQSINLYQQTFGLDPKYLLGLFFMCRDSVLEEIKYEDGTYLSTAYGYGDKEEFELCHRIREKGYKFKIAYDVLIEHLGEITWVDTLGSKEKFYAYQNKQEKILRKRLGNEVVDDLFQIKIEKPVRVMVGIPTRTEYIHYRNVLSLLKIWSNMPQFKDLEPIGRAHVAPSRNEIVRNFLKSQCTHLLFVDDDMVWSHDALVRLLSMDVDIATGIAYQRGEPHAPCIFLLNPGTKQFHPVDPVKEKENRGQAQIDGIGGYFFLVKRKVFETVKAPWFKYGDTSLGYNDSNPDPEDRGIGEDLYFSAKAGEAGFQIWCDTSLEIGHIGEAPIIDSDFVERYVSSGKRDEFLKNKGDGK